MLKKRVQDIVALYWGGNVKAAAKDLAIPQNTLYRIVSGETPNPRVQVLSKIARYCGTSVEWLVSGKGTPPVATTDSGVPISHNLLRWRRLVRSLKLQATTQSLLEDLPHGPSSFTYIMFEHVDLPIRVGSGPPTPARGASNMCAGAWADILEEMIRRYGIAAVRQVVEERRVAAACGFSHFGRFLDGSETPKARRQRGTDSLAEYLKSEAEHDARAKAWQRRNPLPGSDIDT